MPSYSSQPTDLARGVATGRLTESLAHLGILDPPAVERLERMNICTLGDLAWHLPMRYETEMAEESVQTAIDATAELDSQAQRTAIRSIRGEIDKVRRTTGRHSRIEANLTDGSGTIKLIWFHMPWMAARLHPGAVGVARGKAQLRKGKLEMVNPRWENAPPDVPSTAPEVGRLKPIYRASEEVASAHIEWLVRQTLPKITAGAEDTLPEPLRARRALPALCDALRMVHAPATLDEARLGRERLAFDELLRLQLAMAIRRWEVRHTTKAIALPFSEEVRAKIVARLPFQLSAQQVNACAEIDEDLQRTLPMNRLLQGDVGSGKTAVAVYAMLRAVAHGHQAALLAPTEILAEQHHAVIESMLTGSRVRTALVHGSMRTADREMVRMGIEAGAFDLVVGTHALLGGNIRFRSLAVAVIDEQHRFGVEQRAVLRGKSGAEGAMPHLLVMTATPIPRTLALTFFGDLDVSSLRGLLPGRTPPVTRVMPPGRAREVYDWLRTRLQAGDQAFIVVPAVEDAGHGLKDVATHADRLAQGTLAGMRIGQLHGQMRGEDAERVLHAFRRKELDALVATVVIEVGVDIPDASIMVIEHAERFGLAQLHQLRGRVGRGGRRGYCVLIGDPATDVARQRLQSVASCTDGFQLAEMDLRLRGPGEFFGARQSGLAPLLVADLDRDVPLIEETRLEAERIFAADPLLRTSEIARLREDVLTLYGASLGIGDIG
ncbi:MAG: ATP-dependent DNA helicase RecG [Planctomycetota bacterium]